MRRSEPLATHALLWNAHTKMYAPTKHNARESHSSSRVIYFLMGGR